MRGPVAVLAVLTLGLVSACSDSDAPAAEPTSASASTSPSASASASASPSGSPTPEAPTVGPQYVALGDSYAAAPGVPTTSGAGGCFRSSGNYAQLVASAADLTVTDVTCSGATTATVLAQQVTRITPDAELVTIGVGGNDFDLFTKLIQTCTSLAGSDPEGTPCSDTVRAELDKTLPKIDANLDGLFDAIAAAAPSAKVVVVGYPDLLPASGGCPDRAPLATGDFALLNEVTHGLSDLLRGQAERLDLDFVDLEGPSRGHDICSATPWVNGAEFAPDGTIPFHPFGVEQQAVAKLVTALL
ncbi:SGNH/GDSL hydrolase family protein [Nocardioides plantarum]|uniref:SGNH/GDSL hydrolase family protein n=1 Tax=Nocardioides plantarum TaxID=29299 RepID=A0ABV5K469_9ACTN|nr:SGNH/GDSL hydrolase family protein [Nocardioides plantarum]